VKSLTFAIVIMLVVSGCAGTASRLAIAADAELAQLLNNRIAGKPVQCINLRQIRSSHVIARKAIVYEVSRRLLYVNQPRWGAEALSRDSVLLSRTSSTNLCNGEIVRLLDPGLNERGAIALSEFIPYHSDTRLLPSRLDH